MTILNKNTLPKLIRYGLVGVSTWLIDLGLFVLLKNPLNIIAANTIGIIAGIVFGFYTHKYWTFKNKGAQRSQFVKFASLAIANIVLGNLLISLFVYYLILDSVLSKILVIIILSVESFLIINSIIFNNPRQETTEKIPSE